MAELTDDQRQAASVKVEIGNYVATAALGALAGAIALFTYVTQTFDPGKVFYGAMLLASMCLVGSIVFGGKGANATARLVGTSAWTVDSHVRPFTHQAALALVGLAFIAVAVTTGVTADRQDSGSAQRVDGLVIEHARLEQAVADLSSRADELTRRSDLLERRLAAVNRDDDH
jgi:hypothetical protein